MAFTTDFTDLLLTFLASYTRYLLRQIERLELERATSLVHINIHNEPLQDHYEVLGISRDATTAEIKNAFYSLARKWHPDKTTHPLAKENFSKISEAYKVLRDPRTRLEYDRAMRSASQPLRLTESVYQLYRSPTVITSPFYPIEYYRSHQNEVERELTSGSVIIQALLNLLFSYSNYETQALLHTPANSVNEQNYSNLLGSNNNLFFSYETSTYYMFSSGQYWPVITGSFLPYHEFTLSNNMHFQNDLPAQPLPLSLTDSVEEGSENHRLYEEAGLDPTELPPDLVCPLGLTLFTEAVSCKAKALPPVERAVIQGWIQKNQTNPFTRAPLMMSDLEPETVLTAQAAAFLAKALEENSAANTGPR